MSEKTQQILSLAAKYRDYTAENLSQMVKIPSESMQEKDVQALVAQQMEQAGFDEVRIDGLGNVIGRVGTGKTVLAVDGHVDTVGVGNRENWTFEPLSGEIKDGFVHGRGTVDQEGGIASAITAGKILKEMGMDKELTFYVVSSVMEEDCDGLCWKYLVEEENLKPDFAISTEPTNLNIYRGHRGRMEIGVDFRGISCHGSAPERGKNAVYMASRFALEIEKLNESLQPDDFLGKGTVTISEFKSASPSLCAVADYVHVHLDRRLTWGETKESAVKEVEEAIRSAGLELGTDAKVTVLHYEETAYTGLKYGMEKYFPTWKIEESEHVVQVGIKSFKSLFNKDPVVDKWTFSTNGVTMNGYYKIPMIGFGPGNEVLAHAPDEKIPVDHLEKASAFYAQFAYDIAK